VIAGRLLRTAHIAGTTYVESGCGQRAAAISYHVLFSLVPFLALLLTVLDLVLPDSAHDRVVNWLVGVAPLPIDVSSSVEGAIQQAGTPASVAGAIALVGFIWAASGMMGAMRLAFTAVWGGEVGRPYLRGKLLDGALVLGAGLLVLTAFGLTIVVQVATETSTKIAGDLGFGEHATGGIGSLAQLGASLALGFAAFALLYRVVPPVPVRLLDVAPGAAFATVGVHLSVAGFSVYLDHFADFDDIMRARRADADTFWDGVVGTAPDGRQGLHQQRTVSHRSPHNQAWVVDCLPCGRQSRQLTTLVARGA